MLVTKIIQIKIIYLHLKTVTDETIILSNFGEGWVKLIIDYVFDDVNRDHLDCILVVITKNLKYSSPVAQEVNLLSI